ncbi:MAG: PorT family protein [Bacteroidales bacterium]|nr:PorT family protein [Bacteroidales bacterium]
MNKIKIIIVSVIVGVFLINGNAYAQFNKIKNLPKHDRDTWRFGFILATNTMFFTVKTNPDFQTIKYDQNESPDIFGDSLYLYGVTPMPTYGFTIGIVTNLKVAKYVDLRFVPSLAFGERYLNYSIYRYQEDVPTLVDIKKSITSTCVLLPLYFTYKSVRANNFRTYVLGGINYSIDLASQSKNKDQEGSEIQLKLYRNDLLFDIGVGGDFYTTFFKFGIELKMSYGIYDLLKSEGNIYTNGIQRINSKMFQLAFTFE